MHTALEAASTDKDTGAPEPPPAALTTEPPPTVPETVVDPATGVGAVKVNCCPVCSTATVCCTVGAAV